MEGIPIYLHYIGTVKYVLTYSLSKVSTQVGILVVATITTITTTTTTTTTTYC